MHNERKYEIMQETAKSIADTLEAKNRDYGDSFANIYREFGELSMLIRLSDKLGRLRNFALNITMNVNTESLEDVYRDIAGYCILALSVRKQAEEEELDRGRVHALVDNR